MENNQKPIENKNNSKFQERCPKCQGELQYNAFWGYSYCPLCNWCDWNKKENKKNK